MVRIIADSSCNITKLSKEYKNVSFARVPLSITVEGMNYIDTEDLDINLFLQHLGSSKEKSSSACPSPNTWIEKGMDYDEIFMIPISSKMSGSFNSANIAKDLLLEEDENKKIYVVDTLNCSCGNAIIIEKIAEMAEEGMNFENICKNVEKIIPKTKLNFALFSIENLVKNGRVSKLVSLATSALNITIIGAASNVGDFLLVNKARGFTKCINTLVNEMEKNGYKNGKIMIAHVSNELGAIKLRDEIQRKFPDVKEITITHCSGLCSYYAEQNGLMLGYEV